MLVGYLELVRSLYPIILSMIRLTRMGLKYWIIAGSMGYLKGWLSLWFLYIWYPIIPITILIIIKLIWLVGMRAIIELTNLV